MENNKNSYKIFLCIAHIRKIRLVNELIKNFWKNFYVTHIRKKLYTNKK